MPQACATMAYPTTLQSRRPTQAREPRKATCFGRRWRTKWGATSQDARKTVRLRLEPVSHSHPRSRSPAARDGMRRFTTRLCGIAAASLPRSNLSIDFLQRIPREKPSHILQHPHPNQGSVSSRSHTQAKAQGATRPCRDASGPLCRTPRRHGAGPAGLPAQSHEVRPALCPLATAVEDRIVDCRHAMASSSARLGPGATTGSPANAPRHCQSFPPWDRSARLATTSIRPAAHMACAPTPKTRTTRACNKRRGRG